MFSNRDQRHHGRRASEDKCKSVRKATLGYWKEIEKQMGNYAL